MGSRSRLLLVEDDVALRETLGDALDDIGFEVVVACSGTQALAVLDAGAAEFKEVVTDINLGAGPDGWDVGRRARERVGDMPVVYISGDDDNNDEWQSKGVANSAFITKPFTHSRMVMTLMMLLDASRATIQPERHAAAKARSLAQSPA